MGGLTRPHVVWFGEGLDIHILEKAADELGKCNLCLVVSWRVDKTTCSLVWEGLDPLVLAGFIRVREMTGKLKHFQGQ